MKKFLLVFLCLFALCNIVQAANGTVEIIIVDADNTPITPDYFGPGHPVTILAYPDNEAISIPVNWNEEHGCWYVTMSFDNSVAGYFDINLDGTHVYEDYENIWFVRIIYIHIDL